MIKLYEYSPTRSARVRWTLQELEVDFEAIEARSMIRTPELRAWSSPTTGRSHPGSRCSRTP